MTDRLTASEIKSVAREYIQQEYSKNSKILRVEQNDGKAYVGLKMKSYNPLSLFSGTKLRILEIDPSTKQVLSEIYPDEAGKWPAQAMQERMDEFTDRGTDGGFPELEDDEDLDLSTVEIPEPDDEF
jgi:hypothetical protein